MSLLETIWRKTRAYAHPGVDASELTPTLAPMADGNHSAVTDADPRETSPRIASTPTHAQRLLAALIDSGFEGKELTVADLQQLYAELCGQLNWRPRPWNPLAKQFCLITSGPKKVQRRRQFTGINARMRICASFPPDGFQ